MCPPGVDQTCRSRERWTMLAPLLRESHDLTDDFFDEDNYNSSPKNFLLGEFTWGAFDKLVKHDPRKNITLPVSLRHCSHHEVSDLEKLPAELLSMVIADPSLNVTDVVSLALSSRLLWTQFLDHVQRTCSPAPWAHTPILCTGTYLSSLPSTVRAMYPEMDRQELEYAERSLLTRRPGMCPARQWNWEAIDTYKDVSEGSLKDHYLQGFLTISKDSRISGASIKALHRSLLNTLFSEPRTAGTSWILRNHTAREFISLRRTSKSGIQGSVHVKGMPWLSLDKALILRICWSCDNDHPKRSLVNDVRRGKWAGHCFDVVCSIPKEACDGWHDVTGEVLEEAKLSKRAFHASDKHLNSL